VKPIEEVNMAIRIKTQNAVVEVDTLSEFSSVWKELHVNGQKPSKQSKISTTHHKRGRKPRVQERNIASFYKFLGDSKQAQFLKILREKPDGMTDDEMRSRFGLRSNIAMGGTIGGLTKNAKKFGFCLDEIIHIQPRVTKSGRRGYQYRLTREMLEVVPGALV
jgi:hypothetical protein